MRKIYQSFIFLIVGLIAFGFIGLIAQPVEALAINGKVEELRGVWIATVSGIDLKAQNGNSPAAIENYKKEYLKCLQEVKKYGMNAIFFQIRPENDAFYTSELNPISKWFVSGNNGAGWDPLPWMIEEAHNLGIQFHAWLNPYRTSTGSSLVDFKTSTTQEINSAKLALANAAINRSPAVNNPLTDTADPEFYENIVLGAENLFVLNPAKQRTIDHVVNTIDEIVQNYRVDGIHFDDYFYPSGGIEPAVETKDYNKYLSEGGTLGIEDWRRDNVNRLVKGCSDVVNAYNATADNYVAFGISPAPIWAPLPERCKDQPNRARPEGLDVSCGSYTTYGDLYADTRLWVVNEWVDYIIPQCYFNSASTADYEKSVMWWSNLVRNLDVKLYIGTAIYRLEEWQSSTEVENQMKMIETNVVTKDVVEGYVMFSYRTLLANDEYTTKGVKGTLYNRWKNGALAPVYKESLNPGSESATLNAFSSASRDYFFITFEEVETAGGYAVYRFEPGTPISIEGKKPANVIPQTTGNNHHTLELYRSANYKGLTYVLVTYDLNNQPLPDYQILCLEDMQVNPGPKVTLVDWDSELDEVLIGDDLIIKIKVETDFEFPINASISFSQAEGLYSSEQPMVALGDGYFSYSWRAFTEIEDVAHFKIIVSDTDTTTTILTPMFSVVKEYTEPNNNQPGEKEPKSSCLSGTWIIGLSGAVGIYLISIRKREN